MRTLCTRLSGWLLAASCALAPCTASPQVAPLEDRDAALLDAYAAVVFNLEEGRPRITEEDPAQRTRTIDAVSFQSVSLWPHYKSTEEEHRDRAGSKYLRRIFVFKLLRPCVIGAEQLLDYSLNDSREVFGQLPGGRNLYNILDLNKHRSLELNVENAFIRLLEVKGDKIACYPDGENCHNAVTQAVSFFTFRGGRHEDLRSEAEAFWARKMQAVDLIKEHCPARPG